MKCQYCFIDIPDGADCDCVYATNDRHDAQTMLEVKSMLSKKRYKELVEFITEDGRSYSFEIIDKKDLYSYVNEKDKQEEDYWFKYAYIKQRSFEDNYWGTICVPLNKSKYLKFCFNM